MYLIDLHKHPHMPSLIPEAPAYLLKDWAKEYMLNSHIKKLIECIAKCKVPKRQIMPKSATKVQVSRLELLKETS